MNITKQNIHLWISVPIVFAAGLSYGFFPENFLELQPNSADEQNFHKAITGLYFGCAFLWVLGLLKKSLFRTALLSHIFFMVPMGIGRLISIIMDGIPSTLYVYGTIGELVLGLYGLWVLITFFSE